MWDSVNAPENAIGDGIFDRICALAALNLRATLALVTLVNSDQQYFKGLYGTLPEPWQSQRRSPLGYSFCKYVVASCKPFIVNDARENPLVRDNLAIAEMEIVSYLGVPLTTKEGHTVGSVSVIDHHPRTWTPQELESLQELAGLVMVEIELRISRSQLEGRLNSLQAERDRREENARQLVHDLRTPLNSLLLGLRTIPILGALNHRQQEAFDIARRCGDTLVNLVDDLLEAGAAEAQRTPLAGTSDINASELMTRAVGQVAPLAAHRALALSVETPPDHKAVFCATDDVDGDRIVRALVNLLSNAVKFTPAGGRVSISVREDDSDRDNVTVFTVRDTGPGIPPEHHDRIFERYVRLDDTGDGSTQSQRSSGLGLSFVRTVAQAHGGRVELESAPGRGSTFSLVLPRRPPLVRQ